jgi:peptidoglycan/xylan/chitin deacetylase (PgdA/CDA1 family)
MRTRSFIFSLFIAMCALFLTDHFAAEARAASVMNANGNGIPFADSELLYEKLKRGEKVLQDRAYQKPKQPTVYLTFDDGPGPYTGQVLDILKKEEAKATFFVLGELAELNPKGIRRILEEGHALGNHTYNHEYKELYSDFAAFWGQIRKTEDILHRIAGVRPQIVRAPGGTHMNFDSFYFYYMDQAGYIVHDWNVDSGDSRRLDVTAEEIIDNVKKAKLTHEMNVLLHDGGKRGETVKALPEIIKYFKQKGYAFAVITPEVKPMTFSLGRERFGKSTDTAAFKNIVPALISGSEPKASVKRTEAVAVKPENEMEAVKVKPVNVAEAVKVKQTEVKPTDAGEVKIAAVPKNPPLTVYAGDKPISFGAEEYVFNSGTIYVPLRKLFEQAGGVVEWDPESNRAYVHYGLLRMEYDLQRKEFFCITSGKTVVSEHLPDAGLLNNSIMVPLRKTIELLGGEVEYYAMGDKERQVTISLWDQLL